MKITYDGQAFECREDESVLDCLGAHGISVPSSCHAGVCQSCMMRAVHGKLPAKAQSGLKPAHVAKNFFLACICHPDKDIEIAFVDETLQKFPADVLDISRLNSDIVRVRLRPRQPMQYSPGQFIRLYKDASTSRFYSLASVPQLHENDIHLHVRKMPGGIVSGWIHDKLHTGDVVNISESFGECFYLPGHPEQGLLLVGTGCGLAPLYGIILDALTHGHRGPIQLYHGSTSIGGLYLIEELSDLSKAFPNFKYVPCISAVETPPGFASGTVLEVAMAEHADLSGWRIYLCGNPEMVSNAKREAFLAGASMREIYADPFLPTVSSAVACQ
ncbi:MAG TPA: 2Fe-2S iron-sulfur cluster-binding protein [Burkholderiales bacterium]|nr:2Fe-2S iron-sulfur cluster-binding protein [Burkholderiales bacterium]